ncbi:MAG TPA: molybdopterin cofactor-binding domain-containing protein [Rectinemataceae bacterium]|nr:molybdopterin cofactor-binding domain-containing protein [Rectinemataceae bacterium]
MSDRVDAVGHLRGETSYIDDIPEPRGLLFAALRLSETPRGRILGLDRSKALALHPSVVVVTAADIPGENQIGSTLPDETLLPDPEWDYRGQPLALCLAATRELAREAVKLIIIESENLEAVLDERVAAARGDFILGPRTQRSGAFVEGDEAGRAVFAETLAGGGVVVEGRVVSGGQEHVYLETQGAFAERREGDRMVVVSSTQGVSVTQRAIARILGLPQHRVEVEARKLGGGFGGKEDQATPWACLVALGSWVTRRPVKLVLDRATDMRATGKRHPYSSDFRLAAKADGSITAFEVDFFQNAGATCDLSPAIMSRSLFHAAGAYRIPNLRATGRMCRTNLPSFTAFRGFGAPQAFFVIESAIEALAARLGADPLELRRKNLLREGDLTHYGMPLKGVRAAESLDRLLDKVGWKALRADIDTWNAAQPLEKRGVAIIPNCFGISFTKLPMNRGGALVHVYIDGSVLVSTGAVEMGQQVSRKIARVAARSLGVPLELVRVERTSSLTVANTVPTAASTGSDLNGAAARVACLEIRERLLAKAAEMLGVDKAGIDIVEGRVTQGGRPTELDWRALVAAADEVRIDLSAHGFYATPGLFYDSVAEKGSPFAYHVYGAALVEARLDALRGTARVTRVAIVHDAGAGLDPLVDQGQIEGALAQGLGWSLLEELKFGADGRLLSDALATYKLPEVRFLDFDPDIEFLPDRPNEGAVLGSKAVGEPPLIYGIAAYFAVLDALRAAVGHPLLYWDLPLVPEKILGLLSGRLGSEEDGAASLGQAGRADRSTPSEGGR